MSQATQVVKVSRRLSASAERVFDAWLNPKTAGKWLFSTPTGTVVRTEIDPKVGGKFVIVDRRDAGDVEHVGQYLEIDRPRRIVFSFSVPMYSAISTTVSIDIVALSGSSCELTLTHEGVLEEYAGRTTDGWTKILEGLQRQLDDLGTLRITRRFDYPPTRIFDAWTDPRVASKWLFTGPTSEHHEMEADPRVGGKWMVLDRREGVDYKAIGEYEEFDRPRRLVFTFGMPQFSSEFGRVIVEIVPDGQGSIMTLTHERLPWEAVSGTEHGWNGMLDGLRKALEN
ncbi:MAG TPA: SRPBCC domain-containing protein [Steroidobacteraceae bacterium]|jgi:uncharacterized protein YndB with AHSA1/START domain